MQRKWKNQAEKQSAYLLRKREKEEAAAEAAEEIAKMKSLDLRFFGESAYGQNAESSRDEIQIHKQFLRALRRSEIQPGETLRQLAKRTWSALIDANNIGLFKSGEDVWIPAFNPRTEKFDGWFGFEICGALRPDWFDLHWTAPEGTGDEVIPKQSQA